MHNGAPGLSVQLFGGPAVLRGDTRLSLSPFQSALIGLVYAEGRVTRPRVARVLWRAGDEPRVRQRIRQLLHKTNQRCGTDAIQADGDELAAGSLRSDLITYREACADGRLLDAAKLIRGGFLSAELPQVGGEWRDWVARRSLEIERDLLSLTMQRWAESNDSSDWAGARDAAESAYLLRPNDEATIEQVISARARAGKLSMAEAAYSKYLDDIPEGTAPNSRVTGVIERARRIRASSADASAAAPAPFVGRRRALDRGRRFLERAGDGGFNFLLVTGEPGIGKSRLLQELEREAVLSGFRCLAASPIELESRIPLNPILDGLKEIDLTPHLVGLGEPWSRVVGVTLPGGRYARFAGELPDIQETSLPRRLMDAYSMLLESIGSEKPTILFLDDAQWADATTVAALQFAQRRWSTGTFGVVAALRVSFAPDSSAAAKYLDDQEGLAVERIHLGELTEQESTRLVEGISRGRIENAAVRRLVELSGPHPLYLTELTRDYLSGRLDLASLPSSEVTVPVSLKQILSSRIDELTPPALRVAGLLAVAGRGMRLRDVQRIAELDLARCTDHVEELERARLVTVDRDLVEIAHELFRSALYTQLSEARRAAWHRAVADWLADGPEADVAVGELAVHYARAGSTDLAATCGWSAGARAKSSGAMSEAGALFELVSDSSGDPRRRACALAEAGTAFHLDRDLVRAIPLLEASATALRALADTERALAMEVRLVDAIAGRRPQDAEEGIARLQIVKTEAESLQLLRVAAEALDIELRIRRQLGDTEGVRGLYGQVRSIMARTPDALTRSTCLGTLAVGAYFDHTSEACTAAATAEKLTRGRSGHLRLQALNRLIVVLVRQGQLAGPEHAAVLREARTLSKASGDRQQRIALEANLAVFAMDSGDVDRAEVLFKKTDQLIGNSDSTGLRVNLEMNRGELALMQGDFEAATCCFDAAAVHVGRGAPSYAGDVINAGLGLCALSSGRLSEARQREQVTVDLPAALYYDPMILVSFRARMLERRGHRRKAVELIEACAERTERTLVLTSLKLREIQAQMLIREGGHEAVRVAGQALERARGLRLPYRIASLERLMSRAEGTRR